MIRVSREDRARSVHLFEQHDADELVRPRGCAECQPDFSALEQIRSKSVGAANDETNAGAPVGAPLPDQTGERRAVEILAPLVEYGDDGAIRNNIGERNRFFDAAPVAVLRATFANFDDFDLAPTKQTSRRRGAFAVPSGELALRSLLQAADCGDDQAHA